MTIYIGYVRVSTADQGKNGYSLDAQKVAIQRFVCGERGELFQIFEEVESGSKDDRKIFWQAIEAAKKSRATLVVSKLDRLSRSGIRFIVKLDTYGVPYVAADNPHMTKLVVHILAAVGEDERQRIAQRTKEGLAVAKAKGVRLGNPRWNESINDARATQMAKASNRHQMVQPMIAGLQSSGITTLQGLADALNERGIDTPRGRRWHATTVKRAMEAMAG